jgi:hypothetical protein
VLGESNSMGKSASRHHLRGCAPVDVGLIEHDVGSHVCWPGGQHLLLAVHKIGSIECCQLESMAVRDGIGRARLDTVPTENASIVIDVVHLGVALGAADAVFGGILGRFDVNAVGWAGSRAEKTGYAFFQAVFIPLQDVRAAEAGFNSRAAQWSLAVGIVLDNRRVEHLPEGDAHAFGNRSDVFQNRHGIPSIPEGRDTRLRSGSKPVSGEAFMLKS